ncbi:MFS transporter [Cellulomonas fimi]|uniref:MFS transporter n=1 Tax=Cellulomonas fimi TaxID=1708 RepID=A0A7Y0LXL6_CELFI|nr:MFS transporter [Cellulomonas fimi]
MAGPGPGPGPERLWSRDLVLASLANLFLAFVFYSLMTTMALYAVERFEASDTEGGLASSMFVIGAVAARLVAGNLADLVGRRRMLVLSLVVFVLASAAYLGADSFGLLLTVRAVHGVAFALASTAAMAIAQSLIPASRRAEGTGYFTLSTTVATAVGPFLALVLVHGPGYTALFVAGTVASVLGMLVALLLRTPDRPLAADERARLLRFHPKDMLHPDVLPVAAFMFVLAVSFSSVLTFLNSYAEERELQTGASLFFLVYAVVLFGARLVAGRIQDRRGDNVVVYVAITAFALGLAALALARTDALVVVAGALIGLGYGTLMSSIQAVAVGRVPMQRVGAAISTHFFMVDLGVGVGPVVLGLALSRLGFDGLYLALAGVVVLSAALYHRVHGRTDTGRGLVAAAGANRPAQPRA